MDISSPGCQPPAQRLCQPVPPSPTCQLVLHQALKGGSGTYCLNVSLADANSLAMVSTQLVMPGRYLDKSRDEVRDWAEAIWQGADTEAGPGILLTGQEAGLGQAPLFVGVLLVLMAMVLASVIYR